MEKAKKENRIKKQLTALETSKGFQKWIERTRKSLGIPTEGFKSAKEKENWINQLSADNLICSVKDEKRDYRRTPLDAEYLIQMQWFLENNKEYEFKEILEEFDLSDLYQNFIRGYVYYGDFFAYSVVLEQAESKAKIRWFSLPDLRNKGKVRVYIEVYGDTTTKDIDAIKGEVMEARKNSIGYKSGHRKFSSLENVEIDMRIKGLKKEGKKSKEINKIIKDEFEKTLEYEYVLKRLDRFRKKK